MPSTRKKKTRLTSKVDPYTTVLQKQRAAMRAGIRANKQTRALALSLARAEAGAERALRNVREWLNEKFAAEDIAAVSEFVDRQGARQETH